MARLDNSTIPYLVFKDTLTQTARIDLVSDILEVLEATPSVSLQFIVWKCSKMPGFSLAYAFDPPRDDLVSHLELLIAKHGGRTDRLESPFGGCAKSHTPAPEKLGYPKGSLPSYFTQYIPSELSIERFFGPSPSKEDNTGGSSIYTAFVNFDPEIDAFRAILGYEASIPRHTTPYELNWDPRYPWDYIRKRDRDISLGGPGVDYLRALPDRAPDLDGEQIMTLLMPPDPAGLSPTAREYVYHFQSPQADQSSEQ